MIYILVIVLHTIFAINKLRKLHKIKYLIPEGDNIRLEKIDRIVLLSILFIISNFVFIISVLPEDIMMVMAFSLYLPSILVSRKAIKLFDGGYDYYSSIRELISSVYAYGIAGIILTFIGPLFSRITTCYLSRNLPV